MRITKETRHTIITRALAARFKAREAALAERITQFGDAVYVETFGMHEELALTMPQGWIERVDQLTISDAGWDGYLHSALQADSDRGPCPTLHLSKARPVPHYIGKLSIPKSLHREGNAIVKEHHAIKADKDNLRSKLRSLLLSVTTRKQLVAAWPEGEPFFPTEVAYSTALVPVTLTAEINQMLGLRPAKTTPAKTAILKAVTTK